MPRINVSSFTRDIQQGEGPERKQWGRWSVMIEAGFDEEPGLVMGEALRRVEGLIASTSEAANYPMYCVRPARSYQRRPRLRTLWTCLYRRTSATQN